jgi:glucose-6-phosphate dehydrogenase assembly protein OpcA
VKGEGGAGPTPAGVPVVLDDLGAIEGELARLWRENAGAGGEADIRAVLRAASFNLVTVVGTEADAAGAAAVMAAVMVEHPGRVVILQVESEAPETRLAAWVTMHCRSIGGGSQVCGEAVTIAAAGGAVTHAGAAVAALLVPECPAFLWWHGDGRTAAVLDRLAPSIDAVLLDGARVGPEALPGWVARARGERRLPVGDLAWLRGAAWRGWTADCFEPEVLRPQLRALDAVRVEHGGGAEIVGLLHVGWLAARLGWQPVPGLRRARGGWEGRLRRADGIIDVTVRPDAQASGLATVTLEASGPGLRATLARQGAQAVALEVVQRGDVHHRRIVRQPEPDEVDLVGYWLDHPREDPTYAAALSRVEAVLTAAGEGRGESAALR